MRRLAYFISQGIKGLWRNGVMSFASIMVLMCCLIVIGIFSLLVITVDLNLENLHLLNEIVVFTDYDLAGNEEALTKIQEQIASLDNVVSVTHITPDQGLEDLVASFGEEQKEIWSEYSGENNPLSDSFEIVYENNDEVTNLNYQLNQIEGIRKINNRLDLAVKMESLKDGIKLIFGWFLAILFVVSLFVIINTIKLAVYSRRNEISVMRYVGATNWFITFPFVFEGIFIGGIAASVAYLVTWYIYTYVEKMVLNELQMIAIFRFSEINLYLLGGFFLVGIFTGIVGSCISLSKYLKS